MKLVRRCTSCMTYTLKTDACPNCGKTVASPDPSRYSPEDRWSKYRRVLILEDNRKEE